MAHYRRAGNNPQDWCASDYSTKRAAAGAGFGSTISAPAQSKKTAKKTGFDQFPSFSTFQSDDRRPSAGKIGQETRNRRCGDGLVHKTFAAGSLTRERQIVSIVELHEAALLKRGLEAIKTEPVDSRIFREVRQFRVGSHRKILEVPFEWARVPAIQKQIELLLNGTEFIGGSEKQNAPGSKNSCRFRQARLPVRYMLEEFQKETNVHGLVWPGQFRG